ncbi:MAG: PP2C family protein-serine/threonine phosphatase [Planctomycetota bacterium]
MANAGLRTTVEITETFTDVLYLANQEQMPPEIIRLLKQKELTFAILPIDKFPQVCRRLDLIGTVVVDPEGLDNSRRQKLAEMIEYLETENIGTVLLGSSDQASEQDSVVSMDDLWTKISINLECRKRSFTAPSSSARGTYSDELAEQLSMTEALVDNLAEQLRMAGLVQRDFLPTKLPSSEHLHWATTFLPAEWVSGDIYDVVRIDEQHIAFYIADVVGHGVPAALLTIFLKQALVMRQTEGNSYRIFSPSEVVTNLNRRMTEQKLSGYQFATCCYCLLNIRTLQLTYARAGHPYPILIRPDQQMQKLEIRGSLLGIFEQAEFPQQTTQLKPGDKLLLYSDGAEPFIGGFDEQAGFKFGERFCQIRNLPIDRMTDEFNALARSQKIKPSEVDDITTVGLEITKPS